MHVASAGAHRDRHDEQPPPTSALLPVGVPQSDALPELCDGAGEVGGVAQAVVGEALLRVPGVVAALPR